MYTVGQFARICSVSAKTLRHYDAIDLLRPASVGPDNQYRYYARDQIQLMQRILFLRDLGLGLEVIRAIMRSGALTDPQRLAAILRERAGGLAEEIAAQQRVLAQLNAVVADLQQTGGALPMSEPTVTIKEVGPIPVISVRRRISVRQHPDLFAEVCGKLRGRPAGPLLSLYHDPEFDPESCDTEVTVPVAGGAEQTLPAVRVACATHIGPYNQVGTTYGVLFAWVTEHGFTCTGPTREVYLAGPESGRPEAEYVTDVQIPIG